MIAPYLTIIEALDEMVGGFRRIPVVTEQDLLGVVLQEDVVSAVLNHLTSGKIDDEASKHS